MSQQPIHRSKDQVIPILKPTDLVDGNPAVLADGLLEEEAGEPDQEEHDEIGDEEGAAAILFYRFNRERELGDIWCLLQIGNCGNAQKY